ncbi:deoxynucleoside kinase [Allofustis seminis]|uniref:deoxynucleoside kinase n=1 Tax=Allofustis seminis TaxID=166939 RepID=UPI000369ED5D|nr:deoxynucleoside kinase [Allofustis seminis]
MAVIVLAGMIGAGKTTYTTMLADALGTTPFYESVDNNPILEKYYEDPKRYAFALQIFFLNKRFKSIKEALYHKNNVLDRSIYEDALFTRINYEEGNLSSEELDLYLELLDNMMEELDGLPKKGPDLLIYLRGSLQTHLDRITRRGRAFEQIDQNEGLLAYYTKLHSRYDDWFKSYDKSETLIINIDEINLDHEEDRQFVIEQVGAKLHHIDNLPFK